MLSYSFHFFVSIRKITKFSRKKEKSNDFFVEREKNIQKKSEPPNDSGSF